MGEPARVEFRVPKDCFGVASFLAAILVSNIGRNAYFVGMAWAVLSRTGSVAAVSWLLLTSSATVFLSSSLLGLVADSTDKRRLSFGLDLLRAAIVTVTGILEIAGARPWILFTSIALYSMADRGYLITMQSMIPDLVSRDRTIGANSLFYLMMQSGNFFGALLVAILLDHMAHGAVLLANAGAFAISASMLALFRYPPDARISGLGSSISGWKEIFPALRIARSCLLGLIILYCVASAVSILINVLLSGYVSKELGGGVILFGRIESAWAIGAIVACFGLVFRTGVVLTRAGPARVLLLMGLALTALHVVQMPLISGLTFLILGGLYNICRVSIDALVQQSVDKASIGRVKGALETIAAGFGFVVYVSIGLAAKLTSTSIILATYGLVTVSVACVAMSAPVVRRKIGRRLRQGTSR